MGSVHSKSVSPFGSVGSFLEYDRVIYQLSRGSLIEIQRNRYKHWVIVESIDQFGNVWCFHITDVGQQHDLNSAQSQAVEPMNRVRKEVAFNGKAVLKLEPLEDILKDNDSPIPSLCRVNNQTLMAKNMLKTVRNEMPDLDQVFECLHRLKDSVLKYDLKSLNCEHYCTLWKYGIGWSSQVNCFQEIITAALKMIASMAGTASQIAGANGCYRLGLVCLIISTTASIAAKVVEQIDFTLTGLMIENFISDVIEHNLPEIRSITDRSSHVMQAMLT